MNLLFRCFCNNLLDATRLQPRLSRGPGSIARTEPPWTPSGSPAALIQTAALIFRRCVPVEEEDVVGAGQSLQQDLLLRDGVGRVELHPDELPHVLVHQADAGAVHDVSDVGRDPADARLTFRSRKSNPPRTDWTQLQDQSGIKRGNFLFHQSNHLLILRFLPFPTEQSRVVKMSIFNPIM